LGAIGLLSKAWWAYGYEKERVFLWTIGLLFLFTIATYSKLKFLNEEVYPIENIPKDGYLNVGRKLWFALAYTATVFFQLTLKLEKINLQHRFAVLYVFLIYLIGIICLAYMANFVLSR
jgi:hypothetical protein